MKGGAYCFSKRPFTLSSNVSYEGNKAIYGDIKGSYPIRMELISNPSKDLYENYVAEYDYK